MIGKTGKFERERLLSDFNFRIQSKSVLNGKQRENPKTPRSSSLSSKENLDSRSIKRYSQANHQKRRRSLQFGNLGMINNEQIEAFLSQKVIDSSRIEEYRINEEIKLLQKEKIRFKHTIK